MDELKKIIKDSFESAKESMIHTNRNRGDTSYSDGYDVGYAHGYYNALEGMMESIEGFDKPKDEKS